MRCRRVKSLLMEYIDQEINQRLYHNIKSHLDSCPSCKKLEESLRSAAVNPIRESQQEKVPDYIWYRVKEKLQSQKEMYPFFRLITERIRNFWTTRPVLAPAAATIMATLLITVFFFVKNIYMQNILNAYLEEQIQFLSELAPENQESDFGIEEVNLGTSIETFLL